MLDFIAKYWLEVVFGLVVTGMGIGMRKIWNMYKTAQTNQRDKEKEMILQEVDEKIGAQDKRMVEADERLTSQIHNIENGVNIIAKGLLSVQGQTFRSVCRKMLEPSHIITVDEYEQIVSDHDVYNSLGGNHIGDNLFKLIEAKFSSQTQTTQTQE